jgi:hypothetical protein
MRDNIWTDAEDARLRHLLLVERKDYEETAAELGRSHAAICGRVRRLRELDYLPQALPTPEKKQAAKLQRVTPKPRVPYTPLPDYELAPEEVQVSTALKLREVEVRARGLKKLIDLDETPGRDCRFPFGDPHSADFGFCPDKAAFGKRYCEACCAIAFTGVPSRRAVVREQNKGATRELANA